MPETPRGHVSRIFRMHCGKCGGTEDMEYQDGSGNLEAAIEKFCEKAWRVSETWGFVHKACVKRSPLNINFQ